MSAGLSERLRAYSDKQAEQRGDYLYRGQADDIITEAATALDAAHKREAELVAMVQDFCAAAEYSAGCDEGVTPDAASSEIMSWAGSWMAQSYDKARALLARVRGE